MLGYMEMLWFFSEQYLILSLDPAKLLVDWKFGIFLPLPLLLQLSLLRFGYLLEESFCFLSNLATVRARSRILLWMVLGEADLVLDDLSLDLLPRQLVEIFYFTFQGI